MPDDLTYRPERAGLRRLLDRLKSETAGGALSTGQPAAGIALALEPRFMFDAAGVATAADAVVDDPAHDALFDAADPSVDQALLDAAAQAAGPAASGESNAPQGERPASQRVEIAFIDTGITGWEALRDGVKPGVEIVLIDPSRDGLAQMAEVLGQRTGIEAVHVISHGFDGGIFLGSSRINTATLEASAPLLATIGGAMSEGGDILIYGCDVGATATGGFITALADLTGADVSASSDDTGAAARGGDWDLEVAAGSIESEVALTDQTVASWDGIMAATTLSAGDIAVIGINTDGTTKQDTWAFVILVNINNGTTIHFTDSGINGTISNSSNQFHEIAASEGHMTWNVGADLTAGSVFIVTNNSGSNASIRNVSNTSMTGVTGSLGGSTDDFASIGDQIFVYQGTSGTTVGATFIYGLNTGQAPAYSSTGTWLSSWPGSPTGAHSYIPNGLTEGTSALALTHTSSSAGTTVSGSVYGYDNMKYTGTTTGSRETLLAAIGNAANWGGHDSTVYDFSTLINFDMSTDTTPPTLDGANSTPADNATGVAVGANLVIDFSENVAFGTSGTIVLRNVTTGQDVETFTVSSGSASGGGGGTASISNDKLTLNPGADLRAGTQYSVRFSAGSIVDTAGTPNQLAAITDDTTYNFTTAAPTVSLSVNNATINEAAGTSTVTATLSAAASVDTTVTLTASGTATGGGTDYTLSSTTITILAGQTTGTATITAVQDSLNEANETVILDITGVSGGGGATENGTQQVTVTINDDDPTPTLSIANVSQAEGNSGTSTMTFTVTLSAASGRAVSVDYATSDVSATAGTDYTAASGTLTFAAGTTTQTFTVTVTGDTAVESDETFTVTLSNASNATIPTSTATGTITNDDSAGPAITSATYDATTGVLTVTGTGLTNGGAIDETRLTLTGEGGSTHTLTETGAITASSTTQFSLTLNAADKAAVNQILNKAGTTSTGGTGFNLAGAADWHGTGNADTTGNVVTVSNVPVPAITRTYDANTTTPNRG
ncbi:DUF4347 domain-containing protein [Skermanella sp. TT6]|uniref:DUF4347 domain-containing protein n=1 Tax=Skermanella cutis TaxID=2775420 RepID=A0ABX7B6N2_9PROT|nr:DUF4347 domain-containing protein [Skermanella sp. TT6]QQP88771.1 DUF4347 domain-containing protein [Skermanella sp. TT6]